MAVEERSTRIHQQPRVVGHWTPWGSVGEDNRSTWRRLARERPTWRKMACVNVDNNARADTNTGEESQASDIFQTVVRARVGREADQVVRPSSTTHGSVRRGGAVRIPQQEGLSRCLAPPVEQLDEPRVHFALAGVVVLELPSVEVPTRTRHDARLPVNRNGLASGEAAVDLPAPSSREASTACKPQDVVS